MHSPKVSANQTYLSFIQQDSNELHVWDLRGKSKCLARLKPKHEDKGTPTQKQSGKSQRFTVVQFSSTQDNLLAAGLSNGSVYIIDCNTAQITKQINQIGGFSSIKSLCFLKKNLNPYQVLVSSQDQFQLYDLNKQVVIETLVSKKKQQTPDFIDVSHDDLQSIEAYSQTILMRDLKSKQIVAKFEGHLAQINALNFDCKDSYTFVSAANNECLLWNPKEQLQLFNSSNQIQDLSKPDKILESSSSDFIQSVVVKGLPDNVYTVLSISESHLNVYYVKSKGKKASVTKSKTKKTDTVINIANPNEQILSAKINNAKQLTVINGSIFALRKSQVSLTDDQDNLVKKVTLSKSDDLLDGAKKSSTKKKTQNEDYDVMGIEDEGNQRVNGISLVQANGGLSLSLLQAEDYDNLESRLTSVSSKKDKNFAGSLSTVLGQALTSDDTETLDWILGQKDQQMIVHTLSNIKEAKHLSNLFKQIVIRFQKEGPSEVQLGVLLWLKTLVQLHWATIVKKADKEDLKSLGAIQAYIQKKTKYMDKFLLLKGKLDMVSKMLEIKKQTDKVSEKTKASAKDQPMLVYKDDDDYEDQEMQDVEGEDEEEDDDLNSEEGDEEIREIDIKGKKRVRADEDSEEDADDDMQLDDSIEDDQVSQNAEGDIEEEDDDEELQNKILDESDDLEENDSGEDDQLEDEAVKNPKKKNK